MSDAMYRRVYDDIKAILKVSFGVPDDISEYALVRAVALMAAQHDAATRALERFDPESAALFRAWCDSPVEDPDDEKGDDVQ